MAEDMESLSWGKSSISISLCHKFAKEVEEQAGIRRGRGYGVPELGKIEYFNKFVS